MTTERWEDTMSDEWHDQATRHAPEDERVEFGSEHADEQAAHHAAQGDVEFGGLGAAVGSWRSFWRKLKGVFKAAAKKAATSEQVKDAINAQYPGAGDAAQKGMQLVEAGHAGDPQALAQLKAVADGAAAGDPAKAKAHDMLTAISDARKEAQAEVAVGAGGKTTVITASGKRKNFKTRAQAEAYVASHPGALIPGAGGTGGRRRPAGAVTQADVRRAIQRTPAQGRPQLASSILRAQAQGRCPARPMTHGLQPPYGYATPQAQGAWAGVPASQPYGAQWWSPPQYEQAWYYQQQGYGGDDSDYELEEAFAGDVDFPDEGLAGENAIAYEG